MSNLLNFLTIPEEEEIFFDQIEMYEEFGANAAMILALVWLGIMAFALLNYVLFSIGLYGITKNHGIESAGLAWVPVARQWVKGSIVDYHSKCKEKPTKWHVILPIFAVLPVLLVIAMYVAMFVMIFAMEEFNVLNDVDDAMLSSMIVFFGLYFGVIIVTLLNSISNIICDYKIFEEVNPKHAILFTFLSYLLPFAQGICLIVCKKYGTGVKQEEYQPVFTPDTVPSVSVFEPAQAPAETVVNEPEDPFIKAMSEEAAEAAQKVVEAPIEEMIEAPAEEVIEAPAEETTLIDDSDIFTE